MNNEKKSVTLIENFVSWQGEGPDSGRRMIILRFKTCNLNCPWCDTSIKMRISAEAPYQLSEIQKTIYEQKAGLLITGGEPTVKKHFDETVMLLNELDYPIANVETNGYQLDELIKIVNPNARIKFIYSPKIFNEHDLETTKFITEKFFSIPNVYFKLVYEDNPLLLTYMDYLSNKCQHHRVWIMPEGTTRADLIRNSEGVFNACEKFKFNFSSRSHIIFGFI
jgi:organic radical activating enzyme